VMMECPSSTLENRRANGGRALLGAKRLFASR
jgi:hypothetical protein